MICRCCSLAWLLAGLLGQSALAVVVPAGPAAADWNRFRGPNGSGLSAATNLPSAWTEKDYRWKVNLPGTGHASPVVFGDKVFVVCCDEAAARRMVVCLKTADGGVAWQREYSSRSYRKNRDNSFASSTPAVDREHLYVYWTIPEEVTLLALDHQGREVWRRNLGPFKSQHGSGTSPIVFNDAVIVNNEQEGPSFLIALDARTGATRWQLGRRTDRAAYSTPCIRRTDEGGAELLFASLRPRSERH